MFNITGPGLRTAGTYPNTSQSLASSVDSVEKLRDFFKENNAEIKIEGNSTTIMIIEGDYLKLGSQVYQQPKMGESLYLGMMSSDWSAEIEFGEVIKITNPFLS